MARRLASKRPLRLNAFVPVMLLGGLCLVLACGGRAQEPEPPAPTGPESFTFFDIGRNSRFSESLRKALAQKLGNDAVERRGVYFTGNFVTQMLLIYQVAYLVEHGVPVMTAAALGEAVGLVSIVGRIGWGALSDRTTRPLAYGLAFACVAVSIGGLVLAGWYPTSYLPYVYAVLIGIGYAAMAPLLPAIASDLFAGPGFSMIFGALYTLGGCGLAAGTWSAGWIFDATGSYAGALWLGAFMAVLSPLLMWIVARPRRQAPVVPRLPIGAVDR